MPRNKNLVKNKKVLPNDQGLNQEKIKILTTDEGLMKNGLGDGRLSK